MMNSSNSSYVARTLQSGEMIKFTGQKSFIIYAGPIALLVSGLVIIPVLFSAFIAFVWAWSLRQSTEIVITDRRVFGKWGVFSRSYIAQPLDKISSIKLEQGMLGRLFGYGTILMYGSGLSVTTIPTIAEVATFR